MTTPFRATITDADWRGTVASLLIDVVDGRPVVKQVTLFAEDAIPAWPPVTLGRLAREALRAYAADRVLQPVVDDAGDALGLSRQPVSARRARELVRERKPHTVLDDDYLRQLAKVYREAEPTGQPTAAVRERWALNRDTAPKHVAAARARIDPGTGKPFLAPARPRKRNRSR